MLNSRDDRGLVLPIVAIFMILLLVMVAFAVDLGSAAVGRRDAQNASDAAALAGAHELGLRSAKFATDKTVALSAAEQAVKAYVARNTAIPADSPDWATCTDGLALAVHAATTDCISFSSDATQVRVHLPGKALNYQFARVVGISNTSISASAVAEVVTVLGGSTRPILLRAGQLGYKCVEGGGTKTCPSNPPALGPGDFGSLTSPRYRTVVGGGDSTNFALGVDHMLQMSPTNGVNYCDSTNNGDANKCRDQANNGLLNNSPSTYDFANYLVVDSGGELGDVTEGLIGSTQSEALCPASAECFQDSGETITALLYRPDGSDSSTLRPTGSPATPTLDGFGRVGFNGVHISRYLLTTAKAAVGCASAPDSMTVSVEDARYDDCNNALSTYIQAHSTDPVPVFSKEILKSPRFGVAPVTGTAVGGSSTLAKITDFYGIYIDRLVGNSTQVKSLTAFVFPLSMLEPTSVDGSGPSLPYVGGPFGVRLIR